MIGDRIAQARRKINVSQAHLAEKLFISPQAVGKWERGESIPDLITFNRMAQILGVDLNYFSEDFSTVSAVTAAAEPSADKALVASSENPKSQVVWNMSNGNWSDVDFSGLNNLHEKFSSSNMKNCKFIGSEMAGLLLKNNNIEGCDFSNSDLNRSLVHGSNLDRNSFRGCSLVKTEFFKSNIGNCDFRGADLTEAVFKWSNFSKSNFEEANLKGISFLEMSIEDIVFEGVLNNCRFENNNFYKTKFQNATLFNSFFKNNKKLNRVQFINCKADKMTYAFLKNNLADMSGCTLISD